MKAVLQYRASAGFREALADRAPPWLTTVVVPEDDKARFADEMRDADALLHVLEPVTAAVMAAAPRLRLIQKLGVSVNTIDLEAARQRGIFVANMPGSNSQAVAEATLALMLAVLRRVPWLDSETRAGRGWSLESDTFDSVGEIHGRTVGLVGYGEVPRRLAPVLIALGARVIVHSRTRHADALGPWCELDALLAEADIVSLHLPLNAHTQGLIGRDAIARMKPGAILVNTAHGGLVNEAALVQGLRSGHIAAAGLDVFSLEPVNTDHALLELRNVVVMPHAAWLTPETLERSLGIAFENCARIKDGRELLHQVAP
jgi:phosphoglycerate dehydrogenase-like enzyme